MVFLIPGSITWKVRLRRTVMVDGQKVKQSVALSTGTRDRDEAEEIEALVDVWLGRAAIKDARPDIIDLLYAKRLTLKEAYLAHLARDLDAKVRELEAAADPAPAMAPLVAEWYTVKQGGKKGKKSAAGYRTILDKLFPDMERLTLAAFTRAEIARRIDGATMKRGAKGVVQPVSGPTKNRYRAAVSSFATFLVERELLDTNPVRSIGGYGEHDPRMVYYERADAQRLIAGMPTLPAAAAAFAAGFCAEWTAIETLRVSDVDLTANPPHARVRGTKTSDRDRDVPLVQQNRWVIPYLERVLDGKLPTARVFEGLTEMRLRYWQRKTATALGIRAHGEDEYGRHNIHDWRHTHTVQLLRDGYSEQIAAEHLGHANTTKVRDTYGRFKATRHDYAKGETPARTRGRRA